jgi:hypothetical protein
MTMLNTIKACALGSLALLAVACSDTGSMNVQMDGPNTPADMTMTDQGGNNPDMAFVCVMNPMTNDDFLNSCAPASVAFVDIMPFYPTLAPNGVLPSLP